MLKPPIFTEDKLREILHYTDSEFNPSYEAFKSDSYYEIQSGAKGVSKSYSGAIISIYRLVNEKIFCSLWCRNQYSHIKTTLRPMFENVLSFLKESHYLDYTPFIKIFDSGVYWDYDDGGLGRAIYFENWEKIQAFQGKTLRSQNMRFGELVIDEPIEDPRDSNKMAHELKDLYELQEQKLPLLIANTVERLSVAENFKQKIKFFYNIFDSNHFLVQKYHRKAINFIDDFNNLNEDIVAEMLENKFVKREKPDFKNGLGLVVIMYSKFFIPESNISKSQRISYENLKEENYRLWLVTVLGMAFKDENNKENFFMRPLIYKSDGSFTEHVNIISEMDFENLVKNGKIAGFYDGFDPGLSDNSSWVRIALTVDAEIIVLQAVEDLKLFIKNQKITREKINNLLVEIIAQENYYIKELLIQAKERNDFLTPNFETVVFTDNDIITEWLNINFQNKKVNAEAYPADRIDSRKKGFGIISRQNWQKNIFENKLIKFVDGSALTLLPYLAQQLILPYEEKRNEKVNPGIYDLINAFEMSATIAYKQQYLKLGELNNEY